MQLLLARIHHRITLHQLILIQRHRLCMLELLQIHRVGSLDELHHIPIGYLELKDVCRLLHNRIFRSIRTLHHQRIANDAEINRAAGRIGIIDGIALHAKGNIILVVAVNPDTLKHLLGSDVLLLFGFLGGLLLSATHHSRHEAST